MFGNLITPWKFPKQAPMDVQEPTNLDGDNITFEGTDIDGDGITFDEGFEID